MHKIIDINQKFNHLVNLIKTKPVFKGYAEGGLATIRLNGTSDSFLFLSKDVAISLLYSKYLAAVEGVDTIVTGNDDTNKYCFLRYKKFVLIENKPAHLDLVNKYYRLSLLNFDPTQLVNNINEQKELRNFYSDIVK